MAISSFVSFPPSPSPTTTHPPLLRPRECLPHLGSAISFRASAECWQVAGELLAGVGSLFDFGRLKPQRGLQAASRGPHSHPRSTLDFKNNPRSPLCSQDRVRAIWKPSLGAQQSNSRPNKRAHVGCVFYYSIFRTYYDGPHRTYCGSDPILSIPRTTSNSTNWHIYMT